MNRIFYTVLAFFIIACNKEKENHSPLSPARLLTVSPWILSAAGFDDNKNGLLDSNENMIEPCQLDNSYIFRIDGTGHFSDGIQSCGSPVNGSLNWRLLSNDTVLEVNQQLMVLKKLSGTDLILSPEIPGLTARFILHYQH